MLGEAEKVLEYAAERGKSIPRGLMMSVLHNLACCYQQRWELDRCANYVEALIYNLNCQLEGHSEHSLLLPQLVHTKTTLAHYYLLFTAINSQLKRNDAALVAARRAHLLLKQSCHELHTLANKPKARIELPVDML